MKVRDDVSGVVASLVPKWELC